MRQKFKKISAIAASVLMVGMSIGGAFAASTSTASFPNSFTGSNVAVVYGANAASSDLTASNAIDAYLTPKMSTSSSSTTVTGGEAFTIEKSNDKFHLGETFKDAYSTALDKEDFPVFLADGTYRDGSVNADYSQEITLGGDAKLTYFKDSNYNNNEPTLGFMFENGDGVLNYTMNFEDDVNATEMVDTEMPLLGGSYYVLDASTDEIVLLDSANKQTLDLGASTTIDGKTIDVTYISDSSTPSVKFTVDGKALPSLAKGDDYELDDGSYIVVTDIMTSSKDSVTDSVEFSVGNGKITLTDGEKVKMGDTTINGLTATITNTSADIIDSISLDWTSYRKTFLTEESPIVMPGFEKLQFVFDGLAFPDSPEAITLDASDVLTLDMGNFGLELLSYNSTDGHVVGGSEDNVLHLALDDAGINANTTNTSVSYKVVDDTYVNATKVFNTSGLEVVQGDRFILTNWVSGDELGDITQAYYEVESIDYTDTNNYKVVLNDLTGEGKDLTFESLRDRTNGDIPINLAGIGEDSSSNGVAYFVFGGDTTQDIAISKSGLYVNLSSLANGFTSESDKLTFSEADKDGKLNEGVAFTATLANNSDDDKYEVTTTNVSNMEYSPANKDVYTGYLESALATKVTLDKSGDDNNLAIEYYGEEVPATVQLVADGSVSSSTSGAEVLVIKDSEVTSTESRNLIVVGGSCINTVAAKLLGASSPVCSEAFTTKTGVGAGQFLIENYNSPYANGKYALLVAGYDAADTTKAATYLTTSASSLDLSAGHPNVVSSSTVVTTTSQ